MADTDFEAAAAELRAALDARLSYTSKVDGSPQTLMTGIAWIDEHVSVDIPALLQVKSRVDGNTRSLSDALGFVDEHVTVDIPNRLAAIEAKLDQVLTALAPKPVE